MKIVSENIVNHDIPDNIKLSEKLKKFAELVKDCKIGEPKSYLSDYFGQKELDNLEIGHSAIIASDVGTGKSIAIINMAFAMQSENIYIIANRRYCIIQLKREYLKLMGIVVSEWSDDAVIGYNTENVEFMTYHKIAKKGGFYKLPKNSIIVLDEIHYLLNDAMFSHEPEIIKSIIYNNKKRTKRIYISATIDEVLDEIIMLESKYDEPAQIDEIFRNDDRYKINNTLIDQIYLIQNNYEHINLKFYNYSDIDMLADYLNENNKSGRKSLVFVRNKNRGNALKEKLTDSEMVFATENDMPILSEISGNAEYSCSSLLATKVFENGVSIVDNKVDTIVIDEIDCVTFKQFLNYYDMHTFKTGVQNAYYEFALSSKLKADRDKLAQDLIKVISKTNIYTKKVTGNQIQVDKINDILSCAGISVKIQSLGETFGLIE